MKELDDYNSDDSIDFVEKPKGANLELFIKK